MNNTTTPSLAQSITADEFRTYCVGGLSVSAVEGTSLGDAAYAAAGKHGSNVLNSESVRIERVVPACGRSGYRARVTAGDRFATFEFTLTLEPVAQT
jgi:hypothetical protein